MAENNNENKVIEVDYSTIDMSDIHIPTREELIEKQRETFNNSLINMTKWYNEMDFESIDSITYKTSLKHDFNNKLDYIDLENVEMSKFNNLSLIVEENNRFKELDRLKKIYDAFIPLSQYIIDNNFDSNLLLLCNDEKDYKIIRDYYYRFKRIDNSESINDKIERSTKLIDIFRNNNFNIILIPAMNTKEYAEFTIQYLKYEIELSTSLNEVERLNKLNETLEKYNTSFNKSDYSVFNLDEFKSDIYTFTSLEYEITKGRLVADEMISESSSNELKAICIIYKTFLPLLTKLYNLELYKISSSFGQVSYVEQIIINELSKFIENRFIYLEQINVSNVDSTLIDQMQEIVTYIKNKSVALNNYLDYYNDTILDIEYNKNVFNKVNKIYKSNIRSNNFNDYNVEIIDLFKKIGKLKYDDKTKELDYQVALLRKRIERKREVDYILLDYNDKKILDFKDEIPIDLKFNKINKAKNISDNIIPDLIKLNEVRNELKSTVKNNDDYILMKRLEKERAEYLYSLDKNNKYLLYNYLISDIKMDYTHKEGMFKDSVLNKDELYLVYLKELVKILKESNMRLIFSEIEAIENEILYLENKNNEKEAIKSKVLEEIRIKKININNEISKRNRNPEYLHYKLWISKYEEDIKLKYKKFIKIESLPSTGIRYIYPFKLFNELIAEYKRYLNSQNSNRSVSDYENLFLYRKYLSMHYNNFEMEKNNIFKEINELWKDTNYIVEQKSTTKDINQYVIYIDVDEDSNLLRDLYSVLHIICGFIELKPIVLSENELEYSYGILVDIRRKITFKNDILYLLSSLYKYDLNKLNITIVNKSDVM